MVCHHHRRPMVIDLKFMLKPGSRLLVPILDFCGDEVFITRAFDALEVVDPPLCIHHGQWLVAAQPVICPQRAAQKPNASQCDGIVFQQVDVGAYGLFPRFVDCAVDIGVIPIVMIAQHQNHWPIGKCLLDLSNGLTAAMDVARQHHHIGSGGYGLPRLGLDVQIRKDLDGGHLLQSNGGDGPLGPWKFDGEPRIKTWVFCPCLPQHPVATRVRDDAGFLERIAEPVIHRIMAVAMNP